MRIDASLVHEHDLGLIALAGLICLLGTYTGFTLLQPMRATAGKVRLAGLATTAVAGGGALWASQLVAMLAYRPGMPLDFGPGFTALSIAAGVSITGIGFAVAIGARGAFAPWLAGGILGIAIGAMHYLEMAGLQVDAAIDHDPVLVALSWALAVAIGALSVPVGLGSETRVRRGLGAALLTVAMAALHFTAIAALKLTSAPIGPAQDAGLPASLAVAVAGVAVLLLGFSLGGSIVDQHLATLGAKEARRLRALTDAAFEGIAIHAGGRLLDANRALAALTGRSPAELIGRELLSFVAEEERARAGPWITAGAEGAYQTRLLRADGSEVPVEVHVRRMHCDGRDVCVAAIRDISERKEAETRIDFISEHDALTGLPNRLLLRERLEQALAKATSSGQWDVRALGEPEVTVLCLDLDGLKEVNEAHGHAGGDALLKQVATRLVRAVRETDAVARLGGDEFAIVHSGVRQPHAAAVFAERLMAAMAEPFDLNDEPLVIGVSIGIALFPADGGDAGTLLRNADTALRRAKADGRRAYRFFEPEMNAALEARRALECDLMQALPQAQFELHYQPRVELGVNRITGFEALARWRHPKQGMVLPGEFIPLAEGSGLIVELGEWVLRTACAAAVSWAEHIRIAVNLSPVQFTRCDLPAQIRSVLEEQGLAPGRLELEITESVLVKDSERMLAEFWRLKALGVRIAIADFGTGYSSLSYLHRFPFDTIKIDQSFIRALGTDTDSSAIVRAVIGLGKSLGIPVIAEGVETAEQLDLLRREQCDQVQGYLINRPMPLERLDYLLAAAGMLVLPTPAAPAPAPPKRRSAVVIPTPAGAREPAAVGS